MDCEIYDICELMNYGGVLMRSDKPLATNKRCNLCRAAIEKFEGTGPHNSVFFAINRLLCPVRAVIIMSLQKMSLRGSVQARISIRRFLCATGSLFCRYPKRMNWYFYHHNAVPFDNVDGKIWFTANHLVELLGYYYAKQVSKIYHRHEDEFTGSIKTRTKVTKNGINNSLRALCQA